MSYCKECKEEISEEEISERQLKDFNQMCPKCFRIEYEKRKHDGWSIICLSIFMILIGFYLIFLAYNFSGMWPNPIMDFLFCGMGLLCSITFGCFACVSINLLLEANEELRKLDNF